MYTSPLPGQYTVYNCSYQIDIRADKLRLLALCVIRRFSAISVNSDEITYRGYPAKRALSAMRKHGGLGPFGRMPSIYHNSHILLRMTIFLSNWCLYVCYTIRITKCNFMTIKTFSLSLLLSLSLCYWMIRRGVLNHKIWLNHIRDWHRLAYDDTNSLKFRQAMTNWSLKELLRHMWWSTDLVINHFLNHCSYSKSHMNSYGITLSLR